MLFVCFKYDDGHAETDQTKAMYDEFKKSAFQKTDIDIIKIIGELAVRCDFHKLSVGSADDVKP